jgi:hypothetical protein
MEIDVFQFSYWNGYQVIAVYSKQRIGYVTFL